MDTLIPCAAFLGFVVLLFGLIAFLRYISYRETLALAEKGLVRPPRNTGKETLRWGIIITAVGLALCIGLWPLSMAGFGGSAYPLGIGPWMLIGLVPVFFGLALILVYVLTKDVKKKDDSGLLTTENTETTE
jgi:di/tricarboxylate transporter